MEISKMKKIVALMALGVSMMLGGCSSSGLDRYATSEPKMSMEEFFNGPIKGWGMVQDRKGRVVRRFDVVMEGSWEGDVGTLKEKFVYYDGEEQERIWTIKRSTDSRYTGTAGDIIGKAEGEVRGNAVRWKYQMDLKVGDSTYRITFDDWMFRMNDGILINKSYLKKFGITMAELTLFMQKQPASE
jgi:hypothetical protein